MMTDYNELPATMAIIALLGTSLGLSMFVMQYGAMKLGDWLNIDIGAAENKRVPAHHYDWSMQ